MSTRSARAAGKLRARIGLRDRVTIAFGLIGLGLSVGLSVATWAWVTHYLVDREQSTDLDEIRDNAASVQERLDAGQPQIATVLDAIPVTDHSAALLVYDGAWYSTSLATGPGAIPPAMERSVRGGAAAEQRVNVGGSPALVVGVPLQRTGDGYFEVFPLADLDRTFKTLSVTLVAAGGVAAALALMLGRLAGRRALRPLTEFTAAARSVAAGDLDARMPLTRDPDLADLASSFNATADSLQRRVRADVSFAADVSHELRTPVTTMVNSMQLIMSLRDQLPPGLEEPVRLLAGDLERFRRLVVDLLEISRDDSGDDGSTRESVRIAELVRRAADGAAGRPITVVAPAASAAVSKVDKRRLERAVANLVENAERHGGGCQSVAVDAVNGSVAILVDDAGPGVPAQQRARIFDRFTRSPAADADGTGLGLAIVARHVRWHGGDVDVEDRPGGGARFVVRLPAGHGDG
jgi:two-component system sensor histidine kinase MtrB